MIIILPNFSPICLRCIVPASISISTVFFCLCKAFQTYHGYQKLCCSCSHFFPPIKWEYDECHTCLGQIVCMRRKMIFWEQGYLCVSNDNLLLAYCCSCCVFSCLLIGSIIHPELSRPQNNTLLSVSVYMIIPLILKVTLLLCTSTVS